MMYPRISEITLTLLLLTLCATTIAQNVIVDSISYGTSYRKVRLFIPQDDSRTPDRPVLVMLDGQNLFDLKTSYAGEWHVDEFLNSLPNNKQAIIIGIDHGNELRANELTPYKNKKYGGGEAAAFLTWLVDMALPEIAERHKINLDPKTTAIAGSSFGGLFAHFAATSKPEIFNAAGIFSPSYWFTDAIYDFAKKNASDRKQLFYLTAGTDESEEMIPDMLRMYEILKEKQPNAFIYKSVINGAQHNEAQWTGSFPAFYTKWFAFLEP